MKKEEAIKYLIKPVATSTEIGEEKQKEFEAYNMAIESLSAEQVTSKLKKTCDSLLTDDFGECKEQKSKLDLINRADIPYHTQLEPMGNGQYSDVEVAYKTDIDALPSADRPSGEWNTEQVAEILANLFGDECACNFNGIDEWLPQHCEYAETTCPTPKEKYGCWMQFLLQGGADMRGEE